MRKLQYVLFMAAILFPSLASAQFYVTGDDPGKAKWYSIETDNFKVIYPEGTDSLARVYAEKIERFRIPVSLTSGYVSGEGDGRKMPVVIHAYNAANGSVAWAPKRMDLFSVPSMYEPTPIPWATMLSIHESRHVTQMQFGMTEALKPGNWLFGEMWNILSSLIYPGISNIEGDAVITETAWTPSGRGRTADFLNYYWVAFDNGEFRKWHEWRFVGQKSNSPNYYALGYLTMGGFRYLYDCPEYMSEGYHLAAKKPYNLGAFYTTAKKLTGKKFDDAFLEVCDTMYTLWREDAEARMPYIISEPVTAEPKMYTDYINNLIVGNDIYAIKKGHVNIPSLVRIDSTGMEHFVCSYSYDASRPQWSPSLGKLYWSETKTDKRWDLKTDSEIRFMDRIGRSRGRFKNDETLFNPVPSDETSSIAVIKYEINGKSSVNIIDGENGNTIESYTSPDSLQIIETAWIGDEVYVSAISENGYGIYQLPTWKTVLAPQPVMVKDLGSYGGELMFTCDRTGVNELYHFNPETGKLTQKTSTRYGSEDFRYSGDGKWLYYSSQTMKGKRIFRTGTDKLMDRDSDFTQLHKYPIAEAVTRQEKAIADKRNVSTDMEVRISEPERYRKFPHMFNVHSWAPVYVNVDNIMNMSFDKPWQAASLGATGIIQNRLSTATGEFGYSAHRDPYNYAKWRHSGHARFSYSGLYPILEVSVDINDRAARGYSTNIRRLNSGRTQIEVIPYELKAPYIEGTFSASIPFRFSNGGWFRKITPKISYKIGNDRFDSIIRYIADPIPSGSAEEETPEPKPEAEHKNFEKEPIRHSLITSLSGYVMQTTPSSAVYPRWGMSAEAGAVLNIENPFVFSPMGYVYACGYLPGFVREQGLMISSTSQIKLWRKSIFGMPLVNILPRGLSSIASLGEWISIRNPFITKITADYAIPLFIGDIALGGTMFTVKRLVIKPYFDMTLYSGGNLWSAGTAIDLDLHSILTLEWPCSFGVTISAVGGTGLNELKDNDLFDIGRIYVGPNFNVTF